MIKKLFIILVLVELNFFQIALIAATIKSRVKAFQRIFGTASEGAGVYY